MTDETIELLPCAHCGADELVAKGDEMVAWVECAICGANIHAEGATVEQVVAMWNRRAIPAVAVELGNAIADHINYTSELQQQLDDIRSALNAYNDSNLASLAETRMAHLHYLAKCRHELEMGHLRYHDAIKSLELARSILADEPAPAAQPGAGDVPRELYVRLVELSKAIIRRPPPYGDELGQKHYELAHDTLKMVEATGVDRPDAQPGAELGARQVCEWTLDEHHYGDVWETGCGESFIFGDGGPGDNKVAYCMYCGGYLAARRLQERDDES